MKLTEEQAQQVRNWIEEGKTLSEIQKALADEFKIVGTYMEVRFLVDDLGLTIKDKAPVSDPDVTKAPPPSAAEERGAEAPSAETEAPAAGGVSVTVDRIMRPGSVVSGQVVFSDGTKAAWQLDQLGRLGLADVPAGYQPSAEDIRQFQVQLQQELSKSGAM